MPSSVRDEIGIARGQKKPLLIIAEKGVRMDGYLPNYGSYLSFSRDALHGAEFIEQLTASLNKLRTEITPAHDLLVDPEPHDFFSESSTSLTELVSLGDGNYSWTQSITKKLRFQRLCVRPLKAACWSTQSIAIPEGAPPIHMDVNVRGGSRDFRIETTVLNETATEIQASLCIVPEPIKDEYLEYTTKYRSIYLCPIYAEDIQSPITLTIGDKTYLCFDGMVVVQPTKRLKCQYRFPAEYGLSDNDLHFYVGSYTRAIDYIVESEMQRAKHTIDSFGGDLIFNLDVNSPLLRHMYGVAWNPPNRKRPSTGS